MRALSSGGGTVRAAPGGGPAAPACRARRRLACVARRTKSGGGERDAAARKASANAAGGRAAPPASSKAPPGKAPQPQRTPARSQQQQQQQQQLGGRSQMSGLEDFVRRTPGLNRFLDGTLLLGDAVMVLATEASSERLPIEQVPALATVAIGSWVAAAALLGDYAMEPDPDSNPLSDALGWPIFQAVVTAMITWAAAMVLAIGGFAWLVSHLVVEPGVVMEVERDGMLSPQLEVSVALLITMSCWRGMAARMRL
ncbi:hypothetical protein HT031_005703 [Scenedesmus sp. PABB004]|nr:hypothetical protein HT031_005703 [Scenedesmus sp. PABB004]